MMREEEIYKASMEFYSDVVDAYKYSYKDGFIDGCVWADNHPKSPWISIKDDLPCNHEELINDKDKDNTFYVIALVHGLVGLSRMEKIHDDWIWKTDVPTHWFAIPDPPKE